MALLNLGVKLRHALVVERHLPGHGHPRGPVAAGDLQAPPG